MLTQEFPPIDRPSSRADGVIRAISYRSRANGIFDWKALDALTCTAQQRNHEALLTGVLFYEDGRFFQTIEGPPELLAPVWRSIQRDSRHREIEVLADDVSTTRLYSGWDMRWLRKGDRPGSFVGAGLDFLEPIAPSRRFAAMALGGDEVAIGLALERAHGRASIATLLDYAIEPTARALGDAWLRDDIDGIALDVALGHLNSAIHRWAGRAMPQRTLAKSLLTTTFPRERHVLGVAAAAELHAAAGWWVDLEFPDSESELIDLVSQAHYDRIDVTASDALDRGDRAKAAVLAPVLKQASRNPDVEISFGGRAFWDHGSPSRHAWCRFRSSAAAFRFDAAPHDAGIMPWNAIALSEGAISA